MSGFIKTIIIACAVIGTFAAFSIHNKDENISDNTDVIESEPISSVPTEADLLKEKADSALVYCRKKRFNTDFCILVDFGLPSGKKRFFVWDFKADSIKYSSLCAHGYGQNSTMQKPVFSNIEGSYCSSLGRYKIGARAWSNWGINVHYKLHGLEQTNNNAFKRIIVLHSYEYIPETEIHPHHLPLGMSQGCPVISDDTMRKVDELLKTIEKPVLLWIYN